MDIAQFDRIYNLTDLFKTKFFSSASVQAKDNKRLMCLPLNNFKLFLGLGCELGQITLSQ